MSFLEAVGGIVIAVLALVVLILLSMFMTKDSEDLSLYLWVSSLILYITVVLLWMFGVPFPKF